MTVKGDVGAVKAAVDAGADHYHPLPNALLNFINKLLPLTNTLPKFIIIIASFCFEFILYPGSKSKWFFIY